MVEFALDGGGKLPSRRDVGYLDNEIASEGMKVLQSDGEVVNWTPPPDRLAIPDFSQIKSIRKYFNRTGHQVYPAWLYHPTEEAVVVKNREEAMTLGVFYRKATLEEAGRYGVKAVWDWEPKCQWRPTPYPSKRVIDPVNPGAGKTYVHREQSSAVAQHALVEALIPQVAAAVAQALKSSGPGAPAHVDAKEWDKFLAFQAWQKTQAVVAELAQPALVDEIPGEDDPEDDMDPDANALTHEQEMLLWTNAAEQKGIKVDKRWSLKTLKTEVEKAE